MNDTAITTEEKASGRSKVPSQSMKNSFSVNNDMIYFKDELLKEMKKIKLELSNKFIEYSSDLDDKVKKIAGANMQLDEKIDYVSKTLQDKLTNLFSDKNIEHFEKSILETKDNLITNNIKIQALREELRIHTTQYEDIVRNNILYQGMIGPGCKYRNLHEFIDYLNASINNLITANNQKAADMKNFKNKIDNIFHNINSQISEIVIGYKSYVNQSIKDFHEKINNEFTAYEEKLFEQRTLIVQGNKDIEQHLSEFNEKYKSLDKLELNLNENKGKLLENMNESNSKINETLDNFKKEIEDLKNQQIDLMKTFKEIKEKLNNTNIFNRNKNYDLMNIRKYKKIDVKSVNHFQNNINNRDEIQIGSEFNIGNKKFKHQSTETLNMNQNNKENTPPKKNIAKIYLKMEKEKNARTGSGKILKSERLEKFKFLYGNKSNTNDNYYLNRSIDSARSINADIGTNRNDQKINSSIQDSSKGKMKNKNKIEKYTSRDLYDTGLFVNFNSKCEEDNYINNLKNNALCLKLLEKGVKLDKIYNDVINRSTNNPSEYFLNSKNNLKEKIQNARRFDKEKNFFNKSFNNKKGSGNYNFEKYSDYGQKRENETASLFQNFENDLIRKKSHNKIKIKNLVAIE